MARKETTLLSWIVEMGEARLLQFAEELWGRGFLDQNRHDRGRIEDHTPSPRRGRKSTGLFGHGGGV